MSDQMYEKHSNIKVCVASPSLRTLQNIYPTIIELTLFYMLDVNLHWNSGNMASINPPPPAL